MKRLLVVCAAGLAWSVPAAAAANCGHTVNQLSNELMCPTCNFSETLAEANTPVTRRIEAFAYRECRAGASKGQIENQLVAQFGENILAAPPRRGFNWLAWILPIASVIAGAIVLGIFARRWARAREPSSSLAGHPELNGHPLSPELERRVDEELARFD